LTESGNEILEMKRKMREEESDCHSSLSKYIRSIMDMALDKGVIFGFRFWTMVSGKLMF
ncbi:hypothetical protein EJB05_05373, partial [Eragrostis curvula]